MIQHWTEDRLCRDDYDKYQMPRFAYFGSSFKTKYITKKIQSSEMKYLVEAQQRFDLSNNFLLHAQNSLHELIVKHPISIENLQELTITCGMISNKVARRSHTCEL